MAFAETYETGQENIKIVKFSQRKNYYLYVYDGVTRKVGYASLGSANLDECKKGWLKTYADYIKRGGSITHVKKTAIIPKLKEYIDYQYERAARGEIKERSARTYWERVRNRIIPYVEHKKIKVFQELDRKIFKDYHQYWLKEGKDGTTTNDAITTFNHFLDWLIDEDILDAGKKPVLKKHRIVKDFRVEKNPAFTGKDWSKFKEYLYAYEIGDEKYENEADWVEKKWYRRLFVCWVLYQFFSGNRPHETTGLTFGDVTTQEYTLPNGKKSLRGIQYIGRDTKTGTRTSVINGHCITRIINHINGGGHPKSGKYITNDETPLFLNPHTGKSIHSETYRWHFKNVLKLSGLDKKGYTPYSLRSTHITYMLLRGTDVYDVSRNLGNSPEIIRRHYDGIENIMKSDELLKLNKNYYMVDERLVDLKNT